MEHCHHHSTPSQDLVFFEYGEIGVILTLFLNGLIGSFIHCIGMCGPLAFAQTSMRLMNIPATQLTQTTKLKSALAAPYYFGKASTYVLIGLIFFTFKTAFKDIIFTKYLAFVILILTAFAFFAAGLNKSFDLKIPLLKKIQKPINNFFANTVSKYLKPFGWQGFILGMVLGTIPCGLVYASVITATTYSDSFITVAFAMFAFGLATFPGLFLVSYFGTQILTNKFKKHLNYLNTLLMAFNGYLLLVYALRLL